MKTVLGYLAVFAVAGILFSGRRVQVSDEKARDVLESMVVQPGDEVVLQGDSFEFRLGSHLKRDNSYREMYRKLGSVRRIVFQPDAWRGKEIVLERTTGGVLMMIVPPEPFFDLDTLSFIVPKAVLREWAVGIVKEPDTRVRGAGRSKPFHLYWNDRGRGVRPVIEIGVRRRPDPYGDFERAAFTGISSNSFWDLVSALSVVVGEPDRVILRRK